MRVFVGDLAKHVVIGSSPVESGGADAKKVVDRVCHLCFIPNNTFSVLPA